MARPPFTPRKNPTMAKTKGGYDLDVNEAGLDDQIRILEKHRKIAETYQMIAEIENKTKKLEHKRRQNQLYARETARRQERH